MKETGHLSGAVESSSSLMTHKCAILSLWSCVCFLRNDIIPPFSASWLQMQGKKAQTHTGTHTYTHRVTNYLLFCWHTHTRTHTHTLRFGSVILRTKMNRVLTSAPLKGHCVCECVFVCACVCFCASSLMFYLFFFTLTFDCLFFFSLTVTVEQTYKPLTVLVWVRACICVFEVEQHSVVWICLPHLKYEVTKKQHWFLLFLSPNLNLNK